MNGAWVIAAGLLAGIALHGGGAPLKAGAGGEVPGAGADPGARLAAPLSAFATVQAVLQHPRCQNCHIPGDAPLQFDAGITHAQYVQRGPDGKGAPGLPCAACHAASNPPASYGPHMPPGAPNWQLPPPARKMVFIGLAPADLCAAIKDPKRNGGRDLAALREHLSHDKLVLWGWNPGVGRAPVSVPHADLVAAVKSWIDGGAPCPPAIDPP
ncbi:MAG TPA: hypothetical protein VHR45_14535 [Thermoanaerobaculia bacterium]|nr:hypothetical protein [Thermoanaerobaculia bacterium]